jgi:CheY-like chemotaxis protein
MMGTALENSGFRVLTANSGLDALDLYRSAKTPIDLLVTDYSMPGMTGFELAQECCRLDDELGVLYVSGSSPGNDLQSALDAEKRAFLAKPFRQSELVRSAKALLDVGPAAASSDPSYSEQYSMEG